MDPYSPPISKKPEHAPQRPLRADGREDPEDQPTAGNSRIGDEDKDPRVGSRENEANDPLTGEEAEQAQPSEEDGVQVDMATAAYDRTWGGVAGLPTQADTVHIEQSAYAQPEDGSDAAIMLRVRDGDDSGFTYLLEKYRKQIVHHMFRMTSNQAVAEELAQEVFLRVYRSRESYRAEAKFSTWLYRIATNLGVNYARDHRHERSAQSVYLDQPDAETGTTPDVADSRLTAEQGLIRQERMAGIRGAVLALPERQRQAVLMHKYQEMDYREIGSVLKLSESATKSLLFRAYQTLRERLKEYV